MRVCLLLCFLILLSGCSFDPAEKMPGTWSNGSRGQILDVTPNGLYAEVWLDSLVSLSAWEITGDDLTLVPISVDLAEEPRKPEYRFASDGLEFPLEKGRKLRFIREKMESSPIPKVVGLWSRETDTYRKEFLEFTPWSTVVWTRWEGEAGAQHLVSGWSAYRLGGEDKLLFFSTLEGGELVQWSRKISFEAKASSLTISMPSPIGKKKFVRSSREELLKAARQLKLDQ
jgi:hypothetical protein